MSCFSTLVLGVGIAGNSGHAPSGRTSIQAGCAPWKARVAVEAPPWWIAPGSPLFQTDLERSVVDASRGEALVLYNVLIGRAEFAREIGGPGFMVVGVDVRRVRGRFYDQSGVVGSRSALVPSLLVATGVNVPLTSSFALRAQFGLLAGYGVTPFQAGTDPDIDRYLGVTGTSVSLEFVREFGGRDGDA